MRGMASGTSFPCVARAACAPASARSSQTLWPARASVTAGWSRLCSRREAGAPLKDSSLVFLEPHHYKRQRRSGAAHMQTPPTPSQARSREMSQDFTSGSLSIIEWREYSGRAVVGHAPTIENSSPPSMPDTWICLITRAQ